MEQFLKECAAGFAAGDFAAVLTACEEQLQARLTPRRKAEVLYQKGRALLLGFPSRRGAALTCFREVLALSHRSLRLQERVLVAVCGTFAFLGDPVSVRHYLDQLVSLAQGNPKLDLHLSLGQAWFNYALALECMEQWREAEAAYRSAIEEYVASGQPAAADFIAKAWHNLSHIYLQMGQLPRAREAMERSYPHMMDEMPSKALDRKAEYHLAAGDPAMATIHAREALHAAGTDKECLAEVHLTMARIEAYLGHIDVAREVAGITLELAKELRHARLLHQVCRVIRNLDIRGVGT